MIEPVEILITRDHPYKDRGKHKNGCGAKLGDGAACMKAMTHRSHLGLPLSLNVASLRGGYHTYNAFKGAWEAVLCEHLEKSGLPAGWRDGADFDTLRIGAITVEGLVCFPTARFARDQGNFRWFLEKCLGDALTDGHSYTTGSKAKGTYERHQVNPGGWLEDDSIWPVRRYEFGGLNFEHRPGESWTRLILFPTVYEMEMVA